MSELDKKNGFKDFTFGQNKSEFKSITKEVYPDFLEYTGIKHQELFGVYWRKVNFDFCDEKLFAVVIDFDNSNDLKYNTLLNNLEKLFGKSYSANYTQLKNNNFKRYNSWGNDEKVYMFIRFLADDYDISRNCESCYIQLEIGNNAIQKECLKNSF